MRWWRRFAGLLLVLHGLAHSVFPVRGVTARLSTALGQGGVTLAWVVALVGFIAAGLGLLGARPYRRAWRPLALVAVVASLAVLVMAWEPDLVVGAVLDVAIGMGALVSGRRRPLVPMHPERPTRPARRRFWGVVGDGVANVFLLYALLVAAPHPWYTRWGSTDAELAMPLPGDAPGRHPAYEMNLAVSIAAPPSEVWPWLVQIGQDRAGFYSYDWLENLLLGAGIHSANSIHPEWQHRAVGDEVRILPPGALGGLIREPISMRVERVEPERALVLQMWGAFVLVPGLGDSTRLITRTQVAGPGAPVVMSPLDLLGFQPVHFIMERKMLLGMKQRVEHAHREPGLASRGLPGDMRGARGGGP